MILQRLLILLFFILFLLGLTLYYIGTETGTRMIWDILSNKFPNQISVEKLEGSLASKIKLSKLKINLDRLDIKAEELELSWQPVKLLQGKLFIEQIIVNDLKINNRQIAESSSTDPIVFPELPLAIIVNSFLLTEAEYTVISLDNPISLNQLSLSLNIPKNLDNYQLQINASIKQDPIGDVVFNLKGHGDTEHFMIDQWQTELLSGQSNMHGKIDWASKPLNFDLTGNWSNINWQQISSPKGNFKLKGQLEQYAITVETVIDGEQIPVANWVLAGTGSSSSFDLQSLHSDVLGGAIELTGQVGWVEKTRWNLKLQGQNINPEPLQKDWVGKLDLSAKISGQLVEDQLTVSVKDSLVKGTLRGYKFKAQTDLKIINNALDITQLHLTSGASVLKASGYAGQNLNLKWTLESPNLAELFPETEGQLSAQGIIKGSQTQPVINVTLKGNNIVSPDVKIGQLHSIVKLGLMQDKKFDIQLNSSQIMLGENFIDKLDMTGKGSLSAHTIKTVMKSEHGNLNFLGQGGVTDNHWNGMIQELVVDAKKSGRWQLEKPEKLSVSTQQIDLNRLCLNQKQASLCVEGHWNADKAWQANAEFSQLPLSLLTPFMSADLTLDGTVSSTLIASGVGNKNIDAQLNLNAPAGSITINSEKDKPKFKYDKATVDIVINKQGTSSLLEFDLAEPTKSPIKATLKTLPIDLSNFEYQYLPLDGRLTANIKDLGFIQAFTHEVEEVKGKMDIDLSILGTLEKPIIKGYSKLSAEFFLPSAGIHLKNININANSQEGQMITLTGKATSGKGKLALQGNIDLTTEGFPINAELQGERFEMINLPEAWVLASPKVEISSLNNSLTINGEVTIPEAKLEPQGETSAVPVSKDVVIINSGNPKTKKEQQQDLKIASNINVILGDKITITTSNFEGSLKGSLQVISRPERPVTGTGKISIDEGLFSAYGQELEIDQGHFIFAGGPINSPTIDLKAIRTIDETIAGIHATGSARSPTLTLFSKPSMNQDDILSYLLIGRSISQATQSDGDLLLNAALSLGFKGAEFLTETIGQKLGLDEFAIGGTGKEDATLQVGKYLMPDLYIGFGVGLFESLTQFKLRYDFWDYWSIEAESGTNTSADILFKIER